MKTNWFRGARTRYASKKLRANVLNAGSGKDIGKMKPKCTFCSVELKHTPAGWQCPKCEFFFAVRRGQVGRPMVASGDLVVTESQEIQKIKEEHGVAFTPDGLKFLKEQPEKFRQIVSKGRSS